MEINIHPTYKQSLAWQAWENPHVDDVIFGGSAGGGKTRWLSEAVALPALRYPGTKFFLARKEFETLMKTTFVTLTQIVLPSWGLEVDKHWSYNGGKKAIKFYNGSIINLLHLEPQPKDPLYDRFGSHEYTGGGIDELSEIEFKAYDVLRSRVGRWKNEQYGIKGKLGGTLNPSQDWPYRIFYDPWKKAGRPDDPNEPLVSMRGMLDGKEVTRTFVFIQALSGDNQHLEHQYRVNLATISDPVLRARLEKGDWEFISADDVLFTAAGIADLFTTPVIHDTEKFMTVDVARRRDMVVITYWKGWKAYRIEIHDPKVEGLIPVHKTAEYIRTGLISEGIQRDHVLIDQDGVGGGVLDLVPGCLGFSGAAAPFGVIGEQETKEQYENLRAQCIYHFAEKVHERQVSITEKSIEARELVAADLMQFKRRDPQKDGKMKVSKKEDIKDALGRSPDVGDTMWMRAYFDLRIREEALNSGGAMHVFIPDME